MNIRKFTSNLLFWILVAFIVIYSLAPFLWQIITSFKPSNELSTIPVTYWPKNFTLSHYKELFQGTRNFPRYIINSIVVGLSTTILCIFTGSLAAYAFARLRLPRRGLLLRIILSASLFPAIILIVPLYEMVSRFGLANNYLALIIPYTTLNLPFTIWVLTSFFRQIPSELEDAAKVDGVSRLGLLFTIFFPLSAPAMATTSILVFISSWNEFLLALTFMSNDAARTVPVGIAMLGGRSSVYEIPWGSITAAMVLTTIPLVLVVLIFQQRIVEGLTQGAVKG
jgi:multiple sugar transport system permease protein